MKRIGIKTKIFLDGGDPAETRQVKELLGWLDGQTTNPSLIAKRFAEGAQVPRQARDPDQSIGSSRLKAQGKRITEEDALKAYKETVREMREIIPGGSISIQVFANEKTQAEEMLEQARERMKWIPNASIKFPCTTEGLKATEQACREMNVNITLVFSQAQAAAVYEATRKANHSVYISPFVGRLDDRGEVGMDIISNILRMFDSSRLKAQGSRKSHVEVLTASIRNLDHLMYALYLGSNIATLPLKVFEEWARGGFKLPDESYQYNTEGRNPIPYDESIKLGRPWQNYDLTHPLTDKGLAAFWDDWNSLF